MRLPFNVRPAPLPYSLMVVAAGVAEFSETGKWQAKSVAYQCHRAREREERQRERESFNGT